jgi:hypothetical protein
MAVILLSATYVVSSTGERGVFLVSHKGLETAGLVIGGVYLIYIVYEFALSTVIR